MKKLIYLLMAVTLSLGVLSCTSRRYVSARPEGMMMARPVQPRPGYVWIDGNYYWRGGRYVQAPGYWSRPRVGRAWQGGAWRSTPRGYYWNRGRWQ